MTKPSSIISLGILVALLPFISIFRTWKEVVTFALGVSIIWTGNRMRKQDERIAPHVPVAETNDTHAEAK